MKKILKILAVIVLAPLVGISLLVLLIYCYTWLFHPFSILFYYPNGFHGGIETYYRAEGFLSCVRHGKEIIAQEESSEGEFFCGYDCRLLEPEARTCKSGKAFHCTTEGCQVYTPGKDGKGWIIFQ